VPWDAKKEQFICPCHASAFNIHGEVIHAPAPRPLDRFVVSIVNNRIKVNIDKPIRRSAFAKQEVVYPKKEKG
jgi:Rieske Fe-S protein